MLYTLYIDRGLSILCNCYIIVVINVCYTSDMWLYIMKLRTKLVQLKPDQIQNYRRLPCAYWQKTPDPWRLRGIRRVGTQVDAVSVGKVLVVLNSRVGCLSKPVIGISSHPVAKTSMSSRVASTAPPETIEQS